MLATPWSHSEMVLWCFVHVCFVQVTILKLVWCSRCAGAPRCAPFPTDICSVIPEGVLTVEKCAHRSASARREPHTLSLGQNKHGHNNSAPYVHVQQTILHFNQFCFLRTFWAILSSKSCLQRFFSTVNKEKTKIFSQMNLQFIHFLFFITASWHHFLEYILGNFVSLQNWRIA